MDINQMEGEKLIEELTRICFGDVTSLGDSDRRLMVELADFILADRRRIVSPLIQIVKDAKFYKEEIDIRIIQTIKNAGENI